MTDHLDPSAIFALEQLQAYQHDIDAECWEVSASDADKRRHISFHLTIAAGKLARLEERYDHGTLDDGVLREVAADLLIYGLQLAMLQHATLAELYEERIAANRVRFSR